MTRHSYIAALLLASVLAACGENAVQKLTGIDPQGRVKFFNFGVNAPSVNFYADATKMTAVQSTTGTESTTGIAYGGVGAGGAYTTIEPGSRTLTGRIAATTDKDLPIATVSTSVEDGKFYSFYMSGFYNTTAKTVEGFVVEDNFPLLPTDTTVATIRFVHAISNANPMTLYARRTTAGSTEVPVGAEVAYKSAGAFTNIPAGPYDLSTRFAGVTTNALTRTGVSFVGGKVYTITARGDITVAATTTGCAAANRTCLDNTSNR